MELNLSLYDFIVVFFASGAVIFGLAVSIWLWRRPGWTPARPWLTVYFVAIALFLASQVVVFGGFPSANARFYYVPLRYTFALGPLLYFHVRAVVTPTRGWQRRDWAHWVLPALQALLTVVVAFQSLAVKTWFWENVQRPWYGAVDVGWTAFSLLAYAAAAWRLLAPHANMTAPPQRYARLITLLTGVSGILALMVDIVLPLTLGRFDYTFLHTAVYYSVPILFYSLGFIWVLWRVLQLPNMADAPPQPSRKETYVISDAELAQRAATLTRYMAEHQPYLDPDLTLSKLARRLDWSPKHLSYVINSAYDCSYTEYINRARVAVALQLLGDASKRHVSVLDIGLQAGFRSKSTFNRIFREQTGRTPSELRAPAA